MVSENKAFKLFKNIPGKVLSSVFVIFVIILFAGIIKTKDAFKTFKEHDQNERTEQLAPELVFSDWIKKITEEKAFVVKEENISVKKIENAGLFTVPEAKYYKLLSDLYLSLKELKSESSVRKAREYDKVQTHLSSFSEKKRNALDSIKYRVALIELEELRLMSNGETRNYDLLSMEASRNAERLSSVNGWMIISDVEYSDSTKARTAYIVDVNRNVCLVDMDPKKYHLLQNNKNPFLDF